MSRPVTVNQVTIQTPTPTPTPTPPVGAIGDLQIKGTSTQFGVIGTSVSGPAQVKQFSQTVGGNVFRGIKLDTTGDSSFPGILMIPPGGGAGLLIPFRQIIAGPNPIIFEPPPDYGSGGTVILTNDGSGGQSWQGLSSLGAGIFATPTDVTTAQNFAISTSNNYTDAAIISAIGGMTPSQGGARVLNLADGSGGWMSSGDIYPTDLPGQLTNDGSGNLSWVDLAASISAIGSALTTLQAQVNGIAAQLAAGVTGISTPTTGTVTSVGGIVTAIT